MKHALILCVLMLVLHLTTPFWWWIVALPLAYGLFFLETGWGGFRTGMLSAGMLWFLAGLLLWLTKGRIIAERIAVLLKVGSPLLLVLITCILAAIVGGISGMTGVMVRKVVRK